jgi:hypothetical protein
MGDKHSKFSIVLELLELGERAFIHKLKQSNPSISSKEIEESVKAWYRERPGAVLGDGVGVPGDIKRFQTCDS